MQIRSRARRAFTVLTTGALAAGLAILGAVVSAGPALAAETGISWSVSPADTEGPDDRAWIELDLDPGATVEDRFAVRNLSDEEVTFRISAADGYFTPTGRFSMLSSDQPSVDAGTWIDAPESVTIPAGETAILPFTLTVPEDAEPGDHAAGIAASVLSQGTTEQGANVGVESRVGFRVMTRVSGLLTPSLSLRDVATSYEWSWNPLRPGTARIEATVSNDGNVRLRTDGLVDVGGQTAPLTESADSAQELLPGDERRVTATVSGVWPLVVVGADLAVDRTVVTFDGTEQEMAPVSTQATVWALPVPQLAVLAAVLLLIVALRGGRVRSKKRLATQLDAARAEGRREAEDAKAAEPTPTT